VAQQVHCVGKGECALIASLLGLPKDTAVKGWTRGPRKERRWKWGRGKAVQNKAGEGGWW
jgi:hypothetical protein